MKSVAIIGAGITGLTAAFYLKRKGIPVTVYEAGPRVGGAIQSLRQDGYLAEFGPNTILETSPKISQLVRDAGVESRRLNSDPKAKARYVVRYQRPIAMPSSPLGFFTTDLFTLKAKLAVLREPFVAPRRDDVEESIAEFVVRRFNQEFLDHAIDALVAGVYAGDPRKLSVTHAFPKLKEVEDNYGSMIKGQLFGARERKRRGEVSKDRAPKFSFDDGLQVLPDALAKQLGDSVQLGASVGSLAQTSDGWSIDLQQDGAPLRAEHAAAIYAGTAFKLAELKIESKQPVSLAPLSEIRHPPVASVVLGFRREDVAHPCEGFGMLIPKVEGFKILGTIFSSSLFPNRAPAGHLTLTSYIGGERQPELASLPPEKLCELTCEDLRVLLGVRGKPTFQHSAFYPRAIPQYNVGYGRYREWMTEAESKAPGLFLAGHYRDGVSLSDSILSGCHAAERVEKFVRADASLRAEPVISK
ncbi:MAG TPA: protoporphyrinogen oxidase [Verrucomicrobiae bacterium]|jgi:oxygen-dependent protoporphyrinogen oxidase|nr:protoporphyrinogen oxidase [Verrucomicrobiae bacterium]